MKKIVSLIIIYFSCIMVSYASVGIADWPVKEYGLGILGWVLLFIILVIICSIQIIRILYFLFNKDFKKVVRILKFTIIGIVSSITLTYLSQVIDELIQGDYVIYNQEQIEELGNKRKTEIRGDLLIGHINNLSSLSSIEKIKGDLILSFEDNDYMYDNENLKTLEGLNNLKYIGGDLIIKSTSLRNLKGLDNLSIVNGKIKIDRNNGLVSVFGVKNLTKASEISVSYNKQLKNLKGLQNVFISNNLHIYSNNLIEHLGEFKNIKSINSLNISNNPNLNSIKGFESLIKIRKNLIISKNENLISLHGLNNINEIGGDFTVIKNDNLTSLEVFDNLKFIGGDLEIGTYKPLTNSQREKQFDYGNKKLSDFCSLKNTKVLGGIYIKNNQVNPNFEELHLNCD